jgi:hypothetical protein
MSKNLKERIAELQAEQMQLKARAQQLQNQFKTEERRTAIRRKIILGSIILKDIETNNPLRKYITSLLNKNDRDRKLFADLLATSPLTNPTN